jgi:cytidylate kinase
MIIAIDGFSSTGKSTLAKDLASTLGIAYVDTGAMYRAVTLYMLDHDISTTDDERIQKMLDEITIEFRRVEGLNTTFLNQRNVEKEIRSKAVSDFVSPVAAVAQIREKLVDLQRKMSYHMDGLVMDGRDIGTVVFPNADYKFFIVSDVDVRTDRRYNELVSKGITLTKEEVKNILITRDSFDSS